MALMLRKACQPVLNDFDLDAYHADYNADTKGLKLFTPCGKDFVSVSGINFGSSRITAKDIEFTIELLRDWLTRNKLLIQEYLDAFEEMQRTPYPDDDRFKLGYEREWSKGGNWTKTVKSVVVIEQEVEYTISVDSGMIISIKLSEPRKRTASFELSSDLYKEAMVFCNKYDKAKKAEEAVSHIRAKLNTCET